MLRWCSLCACLGMLVVVGSGCGDSKECVPHDATFCKEGVTYWMDSCGNQGEVAEECDCGCNQEYIGCKECGCTPDTCDGLGYECGSWDDGCGGDLDCGGCPDGESCTVDGQCTSCTPDCSATECGPDPLCGISCGDCPAGETCEDGQCVACTPQTCDGLGYECGSWDDGCGGDLDCGTCAAGESCVDGQCEACTPDTCDGLGYECGSWDDGCGGDLDCGTCAAGESCVDGQCEACTPDTCDGLGYECGSWDDGCGGDLDCGTCTAGESCVDGQCEACTPDTCDGLGYECGAWDDGCGGQLDCGTCPQGQSCVDGQCQGGCVPDTCEGLGYECGGWDDGCGNLLDCGTCPDGESCVDGFCEACMPETCDDYGYECGTWDDGCGGQLDCGTCPGGQVCDADGTCIEQTENVLAVDCSVPFVLDASQVGDMQYMMQHFGDLVQQWGITGVVRGVDINDYLEKMYYGTHDSGNTLSLYQVSMTDALAAEWTVKVDFQPDTSVVTDAVWSVGIGINDPEAIASLIRHTSQSSMCLYAVSTAGQLTFTYAENCTQVEGGAFDVEGLMYMSNPWDVPELCSNMPADLPCCP